MLTNSQAVVSRRDMLRLTSAGFLGTCVAPWFNVLSARAASAAKVGVAHKSCILVWMIGGPPQSLVFDVKSHSALKPISTAAPGVRISEKFPKLAAEMKDVTLLRGMRTADSNHATARYLMHTGFRKGQNGVTHPVLGSIVSRKLGDESNDLPNFILVGSPKFNGYGGWRSRSQVWPDSRRGNGRVERFTTRRLACRFRRQSEPAG